MSTGRIQLALNVTDVEVATKFYTQLFGVAPHKQRPGYANFAIADPPLKLVLIENATADGALNHLGVELPTIDEVKRVTEVFNSRSLTTRVSEEELCCHAVQNKVYVTAPEVPLGMWEFYTVLDDQPDAANSPQGTCCVTDPTVGSACCATPDANSTRQKTGPGRE